MLFCNDDQQIKILDFQLKIINNNKNHHICSEKGGRFDLLHFNLNWIHFKWLVLVHCYRRCTQKVIIQKKYVYTLCSISKMVLEFSPIHIYSLSVSIGWRETIHDIELAKQAKKKCVFVRYCWVQATICYSLFLSCWLFFYIEFVQAVFMLHTDVIVCARLCMCVCVCNTCAVMLDPLFFHALYKWISISEPSHLNGKKNKQGMLNHIRGHFSLYAIV